MFTMATTSSPITENNRLFTCARPGQYIAHTITNSGYTVDLNSALNTETIESQLFSFSTELNNNVTIYKDRIKEYERNFELLLISNSISREIDLLTKLNQTINLIKKTLKVLDNWYKDMQLDLYSITDQLNQYQTVMASLKNLNTTSSLDIPGFQEDLYKSAASRISARKAITRHFTRANRIESSLKEDFVRLQFNYKLFSQGIIRYKDSTINLLDVLKSIESLVGNESPLIRMRTNLSAMVLNAPNTAVYTTNVLNNLNDSLRHIQASQPTFLQNTTLLNDDVGLQVLNNVLDTKIYTTNTMDEINQLIDTVTATFPNNVEIAAKAVAIRQQTLPNVLDSLNVASTHDLVFQAIGRITNYLRNLDPRDTLIRDTLTDKLRELENIAETFMDDLPATDI